MLPDCEPHSKYIDMLHNDIGSAPWQYLNLRGVKIICIEIDFLITAGQSESR